VNASPPKTDAPTGTRSLRRFTREAVPYLASFVVLLIMSAPEGLSSRVSKYSIPITEGARSAAKTFGGSDAGSLLTAALSLVDKGLLDGAQFWVYNLWPPGMIGIDAALVTLERSTGVPISLAMVLLNCAAWAALIGTVFRMVLAARGSLQAWLAGIGLLIFSGVSNWGVKDGLFYGDSFGAILWCVTLLLLFRAYRVTLRSARITTLALAGLAFAGAAYFRASYELIALSTLAVAVVVAIVLLLLRLRSGASRWTPGIRVSVQLATVAGVAELLMLPWRLYAGMKMRGGDLRWSAVSDLASGARWIPTQRLLDEGAGFAADGHSNWACLNDPEQCRSIAAVEELSAHPYTGGGHYTGQQFDQMTLQSFLEHPLNFIGERLGALTLGLSSNDGGSIGTFAIVETLVIVALLIATIVVVIRKRRLGEPALVLFLWSLLVQAGTLALLHQEPRYWLGIELSIICVAALVVGRPRVAPDAPLEEQSEAPTEVAAAG
jgi:hypothetical protein